MCDRSIVNCVGQVLEERLARRRQVVEYEEETEKEQQETRDARISTLKAMLSEKVMNGQLLERQQDELTGQYKFALGGFYDELNKGLFLF